MSSLKGGVKNVLQPHHCLEIEARLAIQLFAVEPGNTFFLELKRNCQMNQPLDFPEGSATPGKAQVC